MPGFILTAGTTLTCPHGGQVVMGAASSRMSAGGVPVVRAGDQHAVSGCPFRLNGIAEPCVRVVWSGPGVGGSASRVAAGGQPVVLAEPNAGVCLNVRGQSQGSPIVLTAQTRVRGI